MSDTAVPTSDARKRSRSPSPSGGQSPSVAKKPDSKAAPAELELADDSAIPSAAEDNNTPAIDDATATADTLVADMQTDDAKPTDPAAPVPATAAAAAPVAGEEPAPMAVDGIPAAAPGATAEGPASIQMRALIVTQDASIIIGKQGKNVNEIREKSGSKVTITESVPGNPERVMVVGGQLDAVSKAFGLIVRRINDEPFDVPSVPGSRMVTIR